MFYNARLYNKAQSFHKSINYQPKRCQSINPLTNHNNNNKNGKRRILITKRRRLQNVQVHNQDQTHRLCSLLHHRMAYEYRRHHHVLRQAQYPRFCYPLQSRPGYQHMWVRFYIINNRSCFLATPKTQIKDMFKKARIWFTIAYISSTILTIVLACTLP